MLLQRILDLVAGLTPGQLVDERLRLRLGVGEREVGRQLDVPKLPLMNTSSSIGSCRLLLERGEASWKCSVSTSSRISLKAGVATRGMITSGDEKDTMSCTTVVWPPLMISVLSSSAVERSETMQPSGSEWSTTLTVMLYSRPSVMIAIGIGGSLIDLFDFSSTCVPTSMTARPELSYLNECGPSLANDCFFFCCCLRF